MSNTFEKVVDEPDHVFFEGQGMSFESEIDGVRCTTGFINPGQYELAPDDDEYIILHDGEMSLWEEGRTPAEGWGAEIKTSMVPCFILKGGTRYLVEVHPRDQLFWNQDITQSDIVTYTCFYPEDGGQLEIVKTLMEAERQAVSSYLDELSGQPAQPVV